MIPPEGVSESKDELLGGDVMLNLCWSDWRHFTAGSVFQTDERFEAKREPLKLRFVLLVEGCEESELRAQRLGLGRATGEDRESSRSILTLLSFFFLSLCLLCHFLPGYAFIFVFLFCFIFYLNLFSSNISL